MTAAIAGELRQAGSHSMGAQGTRRAAVVNIDEFRIERASHQLPLVDTSAPSERRLPTIAEPESRLSTRQVEHRQRMLRFLKTASAG